VTPLLGLLVEEESLGLSIYRIYGNTTGCEMGYMEFHSTTNPAQQIAMTLLFTFIFQMRKYHAQYSQLFCSSVIMLAGLSTATTFNELVVRLITSSYAIMACLMCCLLTLPNDCRKVCFNYLCNMTRVMSEAVDDVALTARLMIVYGEMDDGAENDNSEPVVSPKYNTEPMQMCAQLNVVALMGRLSMMCGKESPFAASELVIRCIT
jgi:hypothetical protein